MCHRFESYILIASVLPDVFIGMFGDKLINYEYDRSKGVLWNNKKSFTAGGECGGATENGLLHSWISALKIRSK